MLQASSIKKLNEIYRWCDSSADINNLKDFFRQTITEVIRAESAKAKGEKFSLYNFAEKQKNSRPVMECVYHDSGYKVASDGTALVALKEDYNPSLEGRMFKQNGEEINGVYPKWRIVIPQRDSNWIAVSINEQKFNEWLDVRRAEAKATFGTGCKWSEDWQVRVGKTHTEAERFAKLISAAKKFGTDVFYVHKDDIGRPWMVENENGIAIAMPFWDKDSFTYLDI